MNRAQPLILIADDDRTLRKLLNLALVREGYEVVQVGSGQQAIHDFQRLAPDLVLLDAMMPDMDGFACCHHLRSELQTPIPILMITVLDDQDSINQAFTAGATDYIRKPINWTVLNQRVKRLLTDAQATQQIHHLQQQLQSAQSWERLQRQFLQQMCTLTREKVLPPHFFELLHATFNVSQSCFFHVNGKVLSTSAKNSCPALATQLEPLLKPLEKQPEPIFKHLVSVETAAVSNISQALQAIAHKLNMASLLVAPIRNERELQGWIMLMRQTAHPWSALECDRLIDLSRLLSLSTHWDFSTSDN